MLSSGRARSSVAPGSSSGPPNPSNSRAISTLPSAFLVTSASRPSASTNSTAPSAGVALFSRSPRSTWARSLRASSRGASPVAGRSTACSRSSTCRRSVRSFARAIAPGHRAENSPLMRPPLSGVLFAINAPIWPGFTSPSRSETSATRGCSSFPRLQSTYRACPWITDTLAASSPRSRGSASSVGSAKSPRTSRASSNSPSLSRTSCTSGASRPMWRTASSGRSANRPEAAYSTTPRGRPTIRSRFPSRNSYASRSATEMRLSRSASTVAVTANRGLSRPTSARTHPIPSAGSPRLAAMTRPTCTWPPRPSAATVTGAAGAEWSVRLARTRVRETRGPKRCESLAVPGAREASS